MANETENWVNTTEAAAMLGCSVPTLWAWRKREDFPRQNEHGLFCELDVLEYAAKMGIRAKRLR
jgi:predicted DNA-binding transcriptional regulator AlpA